jgi:hypothetical protein
VAVRLAIPLLVILAACSSSGSKPGCCAACSPPSGACPGDLSPMAVDAEAPIGMGGGGFGMLPVPSTVACTSAADCLPGQVCCADGFSSTPDVAITVISSACMPAPCPPQADNPGQLCQSTAECAQPGSVCETLVPISGGSAMTCSLPEDSGNVANDGGQSVAVADGASTTDALPVDTSTGNDAAREGNAD